MCLGNRHLTGGAVDLARAGDKDAVDTGIACGLAHVEGTFHIGVDIAVGCNVAVRDGDEGCEVEHRAGASDKLATEVGIAHVAGDNLEQILAGRAVAGHILEPAPVVE